MGMSGQLLLDAMPRWRSRREDAEDDVLGAAKTCGGGEGCAREQSQGKMVGEGQNRTETLTAGAAVAAARAAGARAASAVALHF